MGQHHILLHGLGPDLLHMKRCVFGPTCYFTPSRPVSYGPRPPPPVPADLRLTALHGAVGPNHRSGEAHGP